MKYPPKTLKVTDLDQPTLQKISDNEATDRSLQPYKANLSEQSLKAFLEAVQNNNKIYRFIDDVLRHCEALKQYPKLRKDLEPIRDRNKPKALFSSRRAGIWKIPDNLKPPPENPSCDKSLENPIKKNVNYA